ncbi:MAG: helix-turn-helix domain-containing protein [Actinomycetota bacterium]|nr:helix-turn-helix domain-containing protein [Actinomycetota bacterium]
MWKQDARRQRLRERSRVLFGGAQYRLEVGAAIADGDGIVCIKDLAEELGDPPGTGSVNAELKVLERAGLLARVDRERGERRVLLLRQGSGYWKFCQEARDVALGSRSGRSRRLGLDAARSRAAGGG